MPVTLGIGCTMIQHHSNGSSFSISDDLNASTPKLVIDLEKIPALLTALVKFSSGWQHDVDDGIVESSFFDMMLSWTLQSVKLSCRSFGFHVNQTKSSWLTDPTAFDMKMKIKIIILSFRI